MRNFGWVMLAVALSTGAATAQTIPDDLMQKAGLSPLEMTIVKEATLLPGNQFAAVFKKLETSPSLAYKVPAETLKLETAPINDSTAGTDPTWIKADVEKATAGTGAGGGVGGGNTGAGSSGGSAAGGGS